MVDKSLTYIHINNDSNDVIFVTPNKCLKKMCDFKTDGYYYISKNISNYTELAIRQPEKQYEKGVIY